MAHAFAEAALQLENELAASPPDLLVAFISPEHVDACLELGELATRRFPGALFVACTGLGVIGASREAEEGPALSLNGAVLPRVECTARHIEMSSLPDPEGELEPWIELLGVDPRLAPKILLLADPFTLDAHALVSGLDRAYPGAPKFGGLVSGGRGVGEHRLVIGREVHRSGALAVALCGEVEVDTLIAQGCRPIGGPLLVTRCHEGTVALFDRGPPLKVLTEIYESLGPRDQELMQHSLFLGIDMRKERVEYDSGELLIRNIVGVDQESGAIAVGASMNPMQIVQFALRDAHTAEQDLRQHLDRRRRVSLARPAGALLFSCTGRGAGLFGHPDHDTELFEEKLGPAPLGGFFCNGEIGPVGGTTFLHGYTSAFALFREPRTFREGQVVL
jgi:small ligand-binding sensory domain FIST